MSRLRKTRSYLAAGSIALAAVVTLGGGEAAFARASEPVDAPPAMSAKAGEFRVQIAAGVWTVPVEAPRVRVIVEPVDGGAVVYGPLLAGGEDQAATEEMPPGARLETRPIRFRFPSSESPKEWTLQPVSIWGQPLAGDLRTRFADSLDAGGATTRLAHDRVPIAFRLESTASPGTRFSFESDEVPTEPRLPPLGEFRLRITDPQGDPVPRAEVALKVAGDWWEFASEAESTSDGLARLRCVQGDTHRVLVSVEAEGYVEQSFRTGDAFPGNGWVRECPGRSTISLEREPPEPKAVESAKTTAAPTESLALEELTGGEIRGRVLGAPPSSREWIVFATRIGAGLEGYPLARFVTETRDGEFHFPSVPEGDYQVWVYGYRGEAASVSTADSGSVVFDLSPPVRCRIRVVQGDGPLPDVAVQLRSAGTAPVRGFRSVPTTSATGRAVVEAGRDAPSFRPYFERSDDQDGWVFLVLAPIEGDALREDCRTGAVIELPDTSARVRVVDGIGGPAVPGAIVMVDNVGVRLEGMAPPRAGVITLKATTGKSGEVELPGLAPGRWRIVAAGDGGSRRAEQVVELREGAPVLVELPLEARD